LTAATASGSGAESLAAVAAVTAAARAARDLASSGMSVERGGHRGRDEGWLRRDRGRRAGSVASAGVQSGGARRCDARRTLRGPAAARRPPRAPPGDRPVRAGMTAAAPDAAAPPAALPPPARDPFDDEAFDAASFVNAMFPAGACGVEGWGGRRVVFFFFAG